MVSFSDLLDGLHTGSKVEEKNTNTEITDENGVEIEIDTSVYLEVDNKRQFTPQNGFDTVIGYEGDVNSQVILFKLPNTYDSHQLSACQFKLVRWKNLTSGIEGDTDLVNIPGTDYYYWEVDSELYTRAGSIEISLSFEDKKDNKIVYSWNTSLYTALSVGKTITSVGSDLPAKDEILIVDRETRKIVAPQGYNNTVCNRGEVGMGKLYFLINDILAPNKTVEDSVIKFYVTVNGKVHSRYFTEGNTPGFEKTTITNIDYSYSKSGDKLILLEWNLPEKVTMNIEGTFGVSIEVEGVDEKTAATWRWVSSPYTNLVIGKSDLTAENATITPDPGTGGGTIINGLTEAQVKELINALVPEMIDQRTQDMIDEKVSESIVSGVQEYFEDETKNFVWKA